MYDRYFRGNKTIEETDIIIQLTQTAHGRQEVLSGLHNQLAQYKEISRNQEKKHRENEPYERKDFENLHDSKAENKRLKQQYQQLLTQKSGI
jgi:hypothetical protein